MVSQGYTIQLNDMHGKPRSEKTIDKAGNELSSVYYYYKTLNADAPEKTLNNEALVIKEDGSVDNAVIGRDIEMYTDMRSQTSVTAGVNVMLNVDAIYLLFAIVPVPVVLPLPNASYTGFRSAATVKVIQLFGIPDKVVRRQNGSQLTTENLAWDAGSGAVLLTRSQNEFDDPVYNLGYPAHWMYEKGMGPAYKNLGLVINNFTSIGGTIPAPAARWLVAGDELLINDEAGANKKCWVNNVGTAAAPSLVLIDAGGMPVSSSGNATIIRSGRRNLLSMQAASLVSLVNPIKNGRLDINVFTKVLNAHAVTYTDEWAIDAKNILQTTQRCADGYAADPSGRCYKDTVITADPVYNVNTTVVRQKNVHYSTCGTWLTNNANAYLVPSANDPAGIILHTDGTWQNGTLACGNGTAGDADGPLNRSGIWIAAKGNNNYYNQWVGIKAKVFISRFDVSNTSADGKTGYLFLGFGSQHSIEVRIDNVVVAARNRNNDLSVASPMRTWRIKPISIRLDQQHEIFIKVKNEVAGSNAVMGVELYNNTYNQLKTAGCMQEICLPCNVCSSCRSGITALPVPGCGGKTYANVIWSTRCLTGQRFNYHSTAAGTILTDFDPVCNGTLFTDSNCALKCRRMLRLYADKITETKCVTPAGQAINPYTTGLRGNWRLQKTFAYHTDRESVSPYIGPNDPAILEKTDVRKSGAYAAFLPFWTYTGNSWLSQSNQPTPDNNWVKANAVTAFNLNGQEMENADALNRYKAVQFGYLQALPTAVASNARAADLGYDGFEDYDFSTGGCRYNDTCNGNGHFSMRVLSQRYPATCMPDASYAHTGNNSLKVAAGSANASMVISLLPRADDALYSFSGNTMLLAGNGIVSACKPQPGKQYLLSVWIKDDGSNVQLGPAVETGKAAIEVITGGQTFNTTKAGPRVEGWRKVETVFSIAAMATDLTIRFRPGSATAWFDDIRLHPFDAQVKTYAYDNRSMRLCAELDENNFATFYEYDDEGILTRIKKETEKGILTIRETRSTYKIKR